MQCVLNGFVLNRFEVALFLSESFFNFRCVFVIWTVKRQSSIQYFVGSICLLFVFLLFDAPDDRYP